MKFSFARNVLCFLLWELVRDRNDCLLCRPLYAKYAENMVDTKYLWHIHILVSFLYRYLNGVDNILLEVVAVVQFMNLIVKRERKLPVEWKLKFWRVIWNQLIHGNIQKDVKNADIRWNRILRIVQNVGRNCKVWYTDV